MSKKKIWQGALSLPLLFIVLVAIFPSVRAGVFMAACDFGDYAYTTNFDQSLWADEDAISGNWTLRVNMVDDLMAEHDLGAMAKDEIVELLGPPTQTDYFSEWDMVYWLGNERGCYSWDSEWLVLMINKDEEVSDFSIVRD